MPFDWFVYDNGSTDGTVKWLEKQDIKKLIKNNKNVGIGRATNEITSYMKDYDYIVKIDNDCEIISDDILFHLTYLSQLFNDTYILSPRVDGLNNEMPRFTYVNLEGMVFAKVDHIGGIFNFSPTKFYQYKLNEGFISRGSDIDFSSHVGRCAYIENLVVKHMDTTKGQIQKYPEYFKRQEDDRRRQIGGL